MPTVKREVEYVKMDKEQQKYYNFAFDQLPSWARSKIQQNLPPSKRESHSLNTFLSAARQISNSPEAFGASHVASPKVRALVHDIRHGLKRDPNFKSVTYSNFVDAGLKPVGRELESHGIRYGMFTGEQDDKVRQQMVKDYNSGVIKHLLVSPAGVEGLDLKATKLHQILDPHFNPQRTKQAIGRSVRFRSHIGLPENERNVTVKEYLAEPQMRITTRLKRFLGLAPKNVHEMGVEQYIRDRSHEKEQLNSAFENAMGELK
jgi:SNF2 family DNA or RNA helicase